MDSFRICKAISESECLQGHTPPLSSTYSNSLPDLQLCQPLDEIHHTFLETLFSVASVLFWLFFHLTGSFCSPWKVDSAFLLKLAFPEGLSSVLSSLHVGCSPYQTFPLPMLSMTPNPQISSQRSRLCRQLLVISQNFLLGVPQAHLILHSEVNPPSFFLVCSFSLCLV